MLDRGDVVLLGFVVAWIVLDAIIDFLKGVSKRRV